MPQAWLASIAPEHLGWNYTTILNIVFGFVLAAIYWLYRSPLLAGIDPSRIELRTPDNAA